jgi:glycosyltransferase involved in cell wall biosynthesis
VPVRVDQILPNFAWGDAIGNHTLALRDALRRLGFASEIFTHLAHHRLADESRFYEEYRALDGPEHVLLYHYSIGSVITGFLSGLSCRKVLIYHNVTPPEFFRGVNQRAEWECRRGRQELATLPGRVELALGDSEYNRRELAGMGFPRTGVLPIFIPFEDYDAPPDRGMLRQLGDAPAVLHVGRFAPNKRIEDLVRTFFFLRRLEPRARLVLAGTDVNMENYSGAVREMARALGLLPGIVFAGHVTFPQLLACYRAAGTYLSMSEHEGFCVPLVESMLMDLPVVAYDSTAVPFTLGGAGILLGEKDYPLAAEVVAEVLANGSLRKALAEAGRKRLSTFDRTAREAALGGHLRTLGLLPHPG